MTPDTKSQVKTVHKGKPKINLNYKLKIKIKPFLFFFYTCDLCPVSCDLVRV